MPNHIEDLPSREAILDALRDLGVPARPQQLALQLQLPAYAEEAFQRRLAAMEREGQIMKNRKGALCVVAKLDLVSGYVEGHPDGYGFLIPDDGSADFYLGPREMNKVLHGDRVTGKQIGVDRRGRPEGVIIDVLSRAHRELVGRIYEERGIRYLIAEDRRINQDLLLLPDSPLAKQAKANQVVVVEIVEQPSKHKQALARIVKILGNYADPGMEIEIALRKHDLPHEFSATAKKLVAKLPKSVKKNDYQDRVDLRSLPLVTIDGETAKDFDDAVYCEPLNNQAKSKTSKLAPTGFRLLVAIADVSHYVQHADALDNDARERGNSVYFPRRVIPMLPEPLSDGLCSLNPDVDRLCMVCEMNIDHEGAIKTYHFYQAVILSHARLTYTQVAAWLNDPKAAKSAKKLIPHLQNLYSVYQALIKARTQRGAIDFETVETEMQFDEQGKIKAVVPSARNEAHRIIEECMLAANWCTADYLRKNKHPALYRIHEGPTGEKLDALREFLRSFALQLTGGDKPQAKDYAKLLSKIKSRQDFPLLQTVLLRSLQQAVYSPSNVGHFGLAYEAYAHFTSPIRRYPDLLVHRAIKACLAKQRYNPGNWQALGVHCSQTERRADEATRDVENWLKCYFMQDRIGEVFTGTISGVTHFGVFVTLDQVFVDGLIHVTELGNDYFHFEAKRHTLTGERSGKTFRLSDRLKVRLVRVDLATTKIDFVLV